MPVLSPLRVPTTLNRSSCPDPALLYPEGDGEPMAESYEHVFAIIAAGSVLDAWYKDDPTVHVGANNFVYYDENDDTARVAPDLFVVKDLPAPFTGSYRPWLHGGRIAVVIEFTSPSTQKQDMEDKLAIYQDQLRVSEYFLFDPRPEADPETRLFGFRLIRGTYRPIRWSGDRMYSQELGMELVVRGANLRFYHRETGIWLDTLPEVQRALALSEHAARAATERADAEAARANAEAERAEAEAERANAEAEARRQAEAEVERLRELLRSGGAGPEFG